MTTTPILDPLLSLLRSRKVLVALLVLTARAIAHYTNLPQDLQDGIIELGFAIIGAIAVEDFARHLASRPVAPAAAAAVNAADAVNADARTKTVTEP